MSAFALVEGSMIKVTSGLSYWILPKLKAVLGILEWIPVRCEHIQNNLDGSWKFLGSLLPAQGCFDVTYGGFQTSKTCFISLVHKFLLSLSLVSLVCTNEWESLHMWWMCACPSVFVFVCAQVDELYEAFCIQSRLREGASRMKQAFSSSPSTKGTKESIAEVNRRYKEYTEVPA